MHPATYPPALKKGDTLALVAPASVPDRERIERATRVLEAVGFRVKTYGDLYKSRGYLAGGDPARAAALMDAFGDDEVRAVLCARGGYGCARLLDLLDYDTIRDNPKVLVGFSDVTALHLAIQKNTGLITFHGPHPNDGAGLPDGWDELSANSFWRTVMGTENTDFAQPVAGGRASACLLQPEGSTRADISSRPQYNGNTQSQPGHGCSFALVGYDDRLVALAPGVAQGRLTGGNLTVLASLMGTPYEVETDGAVLFLEDVGEQPYRIDRCLAQLRLGEKLNNLRGVLLGHFTDCGPENADTSLSLDGVYRDYFANLGVPVMGGFPAGHGCPNLTLPFSTVVEIDADSNHVTVLDCPVERRDD